MSWKMIATVAAVVIVGVLFFMFGRPSDIDGPAAKRLVSDGARLIDVRTPEEYASGHIDGAVNIPLGELEGRLSEVGDQSETVVVYCRSGNRSARAAAVLKENGWGTVHNLGPMSAWPQ